MSQPLLSPPQRPLPIRALNRVGGWLVRGGLVSGRLEVDGLLARARRATRLADFGPSEHREALEVLVDSLNRDAKLNAFGRFFATRQLMELLTQRLQLVDARKHDPAIAEQRIERPLIVMGLPRTGTTLLYGLLAQDPANRSPLSWEVDDPCPPPRPASYDSDPRIERTEKRFEQLRQLAPGFQAGHAVAAPGQTLGRGLSDAR